MLQLPTSERSPWHQAHQHSSYPQLKQNLSVDAAVVGAGIAGLSAAYFLSRSGLSVAVVDQSTIGSGTTGHTTGKVTSQHGFTYTSLVRQHGQEAARMYGLANQWAVEQVGSIVEQEGINCHWQRDDNYVFTADRSQVNKFKAEAKTAAELGLPATFEAEVQLPFPVQAAVKFGDQGKLHSLKYLLGLAEAVVKAGGHVFENSKAVSFSDGQPGRVKTSGGTLTAKHIVVATKVPTFPLMARGGYCVLEYPTESFGVAGPSNSGLQGMYISPDKGHYSVLPIDTDEGRLLVVVGAGGNLPGFRGRDSGFERQQRLAQYANEHFGLSRFDYRWSAYDYMAYDDIPLVGKLYPWSNNLYVATAFRKWGLSNGTAAAKILHDRITGQPNDWAEVFDSLRLKPVLSIPQAVRRYLKQN